MVVPSERTLARRRAKRVPPGPGARIGHPSFTQVPCLVTMAVRFPAATNPSLQGNGATVAEVAHNGRACLNAPRRDPPPRGSILGVFVWHWVQQHRVLAVVVLALVIVSTAGGTAWALVFRTVSSPVGLREALRMYRREQTGKVLASLRDRLPTPGVYTYRTKGGEGLSLMGVQRAFPSTTSMIVADGPCATVTWVPITQHTEATTVCAGNGGALTVPRLVTDESIAGTTTTSTVRCPATAYLLPPAAHDGERWLATCTLASPAEKVVLAGQVLGSATMVVGGRTVAVEHTRFTLRFNGTEQGTNPTDFWIVASTGLIVREQEAVGVTSGGVRYNETMDAILTGLDPAR